MKQIGLIIILCLSVCYGKAQIHELGIYAGGSNFIGDVGATNYISPNQFAYGGVYKWNRSKRHSYRFSLTFSELEGIDNKSDDPRRLIRDYNFNTNIAEASVGIEFTFFDFDLHTDDVVSTPYIFAGISTARFDSFYINPLGQSVDEGLTEYAWGIPFGLGFKAQLIPRFLLGFEIAARYTFSDNLDGSFPARAENEFLAFGNTINNDWYVFSGFTLTYTFGKNPCYCPYTE